MPRVCGVHSSLLSFSPQVSLHISKFKSFWGLHSFFFLLSRPLEISSPVFFSLHSLRFKMLGIYAIKN